MFFAALLFFCFRISNASTRTSVAIMSVFMVTLLVWWIWSSRSIEGRDMWQNSLAAFRRTRAVLLERVKGFNPFHTHRVLHHDHMSLNSRLGEVGV